METTNALKMGATIAALRRRRGLTQEQLAARVGVSGPAVSKWETDASCPDIALLCPLARALDTTVDRLLQFERELSPSRVTALINELMHDLPADGPDVTEQALEDLLHRYPGCTALLFNAAAVYVNFELFFPDAAPEQKSRWRTRKRQLLEEVRTGGDAAYWQAATVQLAGLALAEDDTDRARALLDELPEHPGDATALRAQLYLKQGQTEQARELLQTQLYAAVSKVQSLLVMLTGQTLTPDPKRQQKQLDAYGAVAGIFGLPDLSDGLRLELHRKAGEWEAAAACFDRYVDRLFDPQVRPDPDLFAPGLDCGKQGSGSAFAGMRQMLLHSLGRESIEPELLAQPAFAAALKRLEQEPRQSPAGP